MATQAPSQVNTINQITQALSPEHQKSKKWSYLALICMVLVAIILDQATKVHSENTLKVWSHETSLDQYQGREYPVWHSGEAPKSPEDKSLYFAFGFNYVRNQGAAWGALSNMDDRIRVPFFYLVTIVAVAAISYFLWTTPLSFRLVRYTLSVILAGAVGNFLDRIRLGYVIDWIAVDWNIFGWYYRFPRFNLADSCITLGLILFIVDIVFFEPKRSRLLKSLD